MKRFVNSFIESYTSCRRVGACRQVVLLTVMTIMLLMSAGCHSSKGHSVRRQHHGKHSVENAVGTNYGAVSGKRKAIVNEAMTWFDTPYSYGESTKHVGSDCSGMVLSVYLEATGIKLPRNSAKQAEFCNPLKAGKVQPGDLVFFATGKDPDRISHVGIMLGEEEFIHVSTSKGVVISKITTPYYVRTFKGFGRVPGM